jgi:hypothetical protein
MTERDVGMDEYLKTLREESGPVPEGDVDWAAFHRRLADSAELPLARLRHARGFAVPDATHPAREAAWWEVVARWSRAALPLAAAAGIVLGVVIRSSPRLEAYGASSDVVSTQSAGGDARDAFASAVIGRGEVGAASSLLLPATSDVLTGDAGTERR